jgi:hypothetical protein
MLKEELKHIDNSDEAVKKTGISVGVVLILISLLLWYLGKASFVYFSSIGGLFVILAFVAIPMLRPFHRIWMMLALAMGFVMSRVILTVLYYLILTPIGLLARIVGKKFMPLGFDKNAATYWEKRENTAKQQIYYDRQF